MANAANTNALLRSIAPLLVNVPDNKKVPTETKIKILELCAEEEKRHAVDYITLSGSLLFSGNWAQSYEELSKQTMYNRMVKTDYNVANYLSGLEVTHCAIIANCSMLTRQTKRLCSYLTLHICRQNTAHIKLIHIGS